MAVLRMPEHIYRRVHRHLFTERGEHFAFLRARWTSSAGCPVLMVHEAQLIPDDQLMVDDDGGHAVSLESIVDTLNVARHSGDALIEVHNHGGDRPRFSDTDLRGIREFVPFVRRRLPDRPYAATVWAGDEVFGVAFLPDGSEVSIDRVTVIGEQLRQIASGDDTDEQALAAFDRQVRWLGPAVQREAGRVRVAIVGLGGLGSHVAQQTSLFGVRDFVLVDHDVVQDSDLARLVTATFKDVGRLKVDATAGSIKRWRPDAIRLVIVSRNVRDKDALDALKGVDFIFGCVDNDGARLILNELALAYGIPYLDLATGILKMQDDWTAGGRICFVKPGGSCLYCANEVDIVEARYFLGNGEEQRHARERGYAKGLDVPAPSVCALNGLVASAAVNKFILYFSGSRRIAPYVAYDLLGRRRDESGQRMMSRIVNQLDGCPECAKSGRGDATRIERFHPTS